MNKELSMCISRALFFTKLHLPNSSNMAGDQRVVDSFSAAAFLHSTSKFLDEQGSEYVLC